VLNLRIFFSSSTHGPYGKKTSVSVSNIHIIAPGVTICNTDAESAIVISRESAVNFQPNVIIYGNG